MDWIINFVSGNLLIRPTSIISFPWIWIGLCEVTEFELLSTPMIANLELTGIRSLKRSLNIFYLIPSISISGFVKFLMLLTIIVQVPIQNVPDFETLFSIPATLLDRSKFSNTHSLFLIYTNILFLIYKWIL